MGYYSRISGRFDIDPDLSPRRVNFPENGLLRGVLNDREVSVDVDGETEVAQVPRLVGIEPIHDDSVMAYGIETELQEVVAQIPAGHTISGSLIREGEEQGDVERFLVRDRSVYSEKASLRWPDGTEVDL